MWTTISQCICGVSHEISGKPCEDYVAIKVMGERLLIAVCDGVGSALHGGLGAKHVAKSLIYSAQRFLPASVGLSDWRQRITHCFQLAHGALLELADSRDLPFDSLATTAILTLATPRFVICGHIGDGACIAVDGSGDYVALSSPEHGKAIHETRLLTDEEFPRNVRYRAFCGSISGVAVLTDGLETESLVRLLTPHRPFFGPLFRWMEESLPGEANARLRDFLTSDELRSRTQDDLSLVLALTRGRHDE